MIYFFRIDLFSGTNVRLYFVKVVMFVTIYIDYQICKAYIETIYRILNNLHINILRSIIDSLLTQRGMVDKRKRLHVCTLHAVNLFGD